jgi:hypothetical protein
VAAGTVRIHVEKPAARDVSVDHEERIVIVIVNRWVRWGGEWGKIGMLLRMGMKRDRDAENGVRVSGRDRGGGDGLVYDVDGDPMSDAWLFRGEATQEVWHP